MSIIQCSCGCGSHFEERDGHNRIRRFVSGHNSRIDNPNKKEKLKQVCKTCGKEYRRSPSLASRGKNTYCSNECRAKNTKEWNGGSKNPNWRGGFDGVQNLRWSPEYGEWRKSVFVKDGYTCQKCGNQATHKNPLHAHHVIPFSESLEFAFDVENGLTLCRECHLKQHMKLPTVSIPSIWVGDQPELSYTTTSFPPGNGYTYVSNT